MRDALSLLDELRLNFTSESLFILNLSLAFIMFGVALDIKVNHFKQIAGNPKPVVIGFISQFFVLPALTTLLVIILNKQITPAVALGMILVAACPGGNISNFISALAKGNAALSVSLTAIATLSAVILTPFNFAFWGGMYTNWVTHIDATSFLRPLEIDPVQMFQTVFMILGIPLLLGMFFNHRFDKASTKLHKPFRYFSILFFMAIVVLAFRSNYDVFIHHIKYIFIIVLIHNALALGSGFLMGLFFRLRKIDRRTISIETGIQNSGLALVLLFNPKIFPGDLHNGGMAVIAAWWGIWHILSGLTIAALWRRIKTD